MGISYQIVSDYDNKTVRIAFTRTLYVYHATILYLATSHISTHDLVRSQYWSMLTNSRPMRNGDAVDVGWVDAIDRIRVVGDYTRMHAPVHADVHASASFNSPIIMVNHLIRPVESHVLLSWIRVCQPHRTARRQVVMEPREQYKICVCAMWVATGRHLWALLIVGPFLGSRYCEREIECVCVRSCTVCVCVYVSVRSVCAGWCKNKTN